jgi:hypothetical protein
LSLEAPSCWPAVTGTATPPVRRLEPLRSQPEPRPSRARFLCIADPNTWLPARLGARGKTIRTRRSSPRQLAETGSQSHQTNRALTADSWNVVGKIADRTEECSIARATRFCDRNAMGDLGRNLRLALERCVPAKCFPHPSSEELKEEYLGKTTRCFALPAS